MALENVKGIFEGTKPSREGTTAIGLGSLAYVKPWIKNAFKTCSLKSIHIALPVVASHRSTSLLHAKISNILLLSQLFLLTE
jgi:hypothetical protein